MRRSNDISQADGFVPAPNVGKHEDPDFGTHHARDAHHVFETLDLDLNLFSSAVKLNTQYMHSIWFNLELERDITLEEVKQRLRDNPLVAVTDKRYANLIFSFGRDHGYYGRILSQTVAVMPTLAVRNKREVYGFCFTPQDGNSLLSSVAADPLADRARLGERRRTACSRSAAGCTGRSDGHPGYAVRAFGIRPCDLVCDPSSCDFGDLRIEGWSRAGDDNWFRVHPPGLALDVGRGRAPARRRAGRLPQPRPPRPRDGAALRPLAALAPPARCTPGCSVRRRSPSALGAFIAAAERMERARYRYDAGRRSPPATGWRWARG